MCYGTFVTYLFNMVFQATSNSKICLNETILPDKMSNAAFF